MTGSIAGTRSLKVLEAAARHLNFTRAAAELGLTPGAVSHQIKELETQLGVDIFIRTHRSLRPTAAGKIFTEAATNALAALATAARRARQTQPGAPLRISASSSITAKWLVPRMHRFAQLEPKTDVRIDMTCETPSLNRDDVDVAICYGQAIAAGTRADPLFDHSIFPVCSPMWLQAVLPLESPADLLRHTLIHLSWSGLGVTWPDWRTWMLAAGVERYEPRPGLHFEDSSLAIQAAIEGHGVALGDAALVADDLITGRLVRPFALAIDGPPQFAYFLVSRLDSSDNPVVYRFHEWALGEAQKTREDMAALGYARSRERAVFNSTRLTVSSSGNAMMTPMAQRSPIARSSS
jgi:LysR family transcriptional regulator, glycine cleavage system transcriptional activator